MVERRAALAALILTGCSVQVAPRAQRTPSVREPTVTRLAGTMGARGTADGRSAARFSEPTMIVRDGAGGFFVADTAAIRRVTLEGEVTTLAGDGTTDTRDGVGHDAHVNHPGGLAYDGAGTLYFSDAGGHTIRKLALATGVVSTVAGVAHVPGHEDGIGTAARFFAPKGLALDDEGHLFVAEFGNTVIREITLREGSVSTLAGSPRLTGTEDGEGPGAGFRGPVDVAYDGHGALYVVDAGASRLRRVEIATGAVTTAARAKAPSAIAYDGAGTMYFTDGRAIRTLAIATGIVTTWSSEQMPGPGMPATVVKPWGLAVIAPDDLAVVDRHGYTVLRIR